MTPDTFTPAETRISWHSFEMWKLKQNPCTMPTYYTPAIEEFHHGFEYEIFEDWDTQPQKSWHKQVYGQNGIDPEAIDYVSRTIINRCPFVNRFRVKHLDRDDLEELGWTVARSDDTSGYATINFRESSISIRYPDKVRITLYSPDGCLEPELYFFEATIRNKSELARVMKQVGIEQPVKEKA